MGAQKVVFRTDASLLIGSGHVIRCLTLAEALKAQGAECHFICRTHPGHLLELIRHRGFSLTALPVELRMPSGNTQVPSERSKEPAHASWLSCDWKTDADQTRAVLYNQQTEWLVVDHYALDQRWESALRQCARKLMVIDDLADRAHQCDLLLDQNLGRQIKDYANLVPAHCKVLVGPHYALLGPKFAALRAYSLQRRLNPVLKKVLITMGGVDQSNATGQVLQALKAWTLPKGSRISVVMGLRAPWVKQVREQAQDMLCPTEVLVNISDMAERMADSDLAIGAAGSTSWERCCLGLPTLMMVLADNQRAIAEALQDAGAANTLDTASDVPMKCEELSSNPCILHNMSIAAARIADGLGTAKIVSYFLELKDL